MKDIYTILSEIHSNNAKASLTYRDGKGNVTTRTIEVEEAHITHVIAKVENGFRRFNIDRIISVH